MVLWEDAFPCGEGARVRVRVRARARVRIRVTVGAHDEADDEDVRDVGHAR